MSAANSPWVTVGGVTRPAGTSLERGILTGSPGTTAEQDRVAALTLAAYARDTADLRQLLQMCGLLPSGSRPRTNFVPKPVPTGYRRP